MAKYKVYRKYRGVTVNADSLEERTSHFALIKGKEVVAVCPKDCLVVKEEGN